MNSFEKMIVMKQAPQAEVLLLSHQYSAGWYASLKTVSEDKSKLELSTEASSPDLAIDNLYAKYQKAIGTGVPEFSPKLIEAPSQDATFTDDIPF